MWRRWLIILMSLLPLRELSAQRVGHTALQDTSDVDVRAGWRPLRIAKWTTLVVAGGAAAYGFTQNRAADRDYERLEAECEAAPNACLRDSDGAYLDAALEARYQEIVDRDGHARLALLAGQIGILASVIMFIIDLPDRQEPEDIPYEPKPVRFGFSRAGTAQVTVQLAVPRF